MHILLGALGAVVTILVLLYRLADIGIDLGGLNPFAWRRRRAWRGRFEANPVFSLSDPREIAALLIVGTAKIDGDLSAGEKQAILRELESTLSLGEKGASELLASTAYLLGDMQVFSAQSRELAERYREHLSAGQIRSLLEICDRIAALDGGTTSRQEALLATLRDVLDPAPGAGGTWA